MTPDSEDAITSEEIAGIAPAPEPSEGGVRQETKRNAFAELMSPKKPKAAKTGTGTAADPPPTLASTRGALTKGLKARDGLGAYTADPTSFPAGRVIFHGPSFVAINDLYPKASVHTLLLPRGSPLNRLHPFDAFEDAEFLAAVRVETSRLRRLVAKELQRRFGHFSAQDRLREAVLAGGDDNDKEDGAPLEELPPGRDWESDLLVGVHARPSMNDLHVHVLSPDMVSSCMTRAKHYQTFHTPFLVDIADFPLAADDPRRHPGRAGYLDGDLRCWRCGKNFGRQFTKLKAHLAEEFEEWRKQ